MAQTYVVEGGQEEGIQNVLGFAEHVLHMSPKGNPDLIILRYGVCTVDNAKKVLSYASQSGVSGQKLIVLATERIFHEAQNILLKVFEEPPEGTTMMIIIPSLGMLLPTLRSRLIALPTHGAGETQDLIDPATVFLKASQIEREKIVKKLLDKSKSDKDTEKQAARIEAELIVAGITKAVHTAWRKKKSPEYEVLLGELVTFTPMLYQPSAPLKLIFEHILLTVPKL